VALTLHGTVSDNTVALDRKTATPLIINGDMAIAQRGTSATGITETGYNTIDRFQVGLANLGTWTQSQSTDVPTGQGFSSSLKMDCTTADASPASSDNLAIMQKFEGQNLQMLKKGTSSAESVTVAFWVKSAKTGTYILELRDADNVRIICKAYTIDSANTWEKKVLSFAGDTTGVLDNDNALSFHARWWLGAGSTFTSGTLATSWEASNNANRAVGQVNLADSTSNDWYITGVQLEVGTFDSNSIPPFQFEDRTTSLARCQRYYMKIDGFAGTGRRFGSGIVHSSTSMLMNVPVSTVMRSNPSITFSNIQLNDGSTSVTLDSVNTIENFQSVIYVIGVHNESVTTTRPAQFRNSSTSGYMDFDSEL
jgi:hypothetical protein